MRTEELMIGNIIKIDKGIGIICNIATKEYELWNIGDNEYNIRVDIKGSYYECSEEELIPIKITPRLLRSIEFEEETSDFLGYDIFNWFSKKNDEYSLNISKETGDISHLWFAYIENPNYERVAGCNLQYLHQLQNFMNLVGHPLEINLETLYINNGSYIL